MLWKMIGGIDMKKQKTLVGIKSERQLYNVRKEWADWIDGGASVRTGQKYIAKNLPLVEARTLVEKLRRENRQSRDFGLVPYSRCANSHRNLIYNITKARPHLPRGVEYDDL